MRPRDAVAQTFEPPDKSMTLENSAAFQAVAYRRADRAIEALREFATHRIKEMQQIQHGECESDCPVRCLWEEDRVEIVNAILGPKKEA